MRYHSGAVRFVLDTDVVVASLRSSSGASRRLLGAALNGDYELVLSVPFILEYEAVLTRPEHLKAMFLSAEDVIMVLDDLAAVAVPVTLTFRWRPQLADPNDDMVLETAMNGSADAIVTFNRRDFERGARTFQCAVLSPSDALLKLEGL